MLLEGPARHVRSTLLAAPPLPCSSLRLWLKQAPACSVLQVEVQCAIALSSHTGSAIAHALLGVVMRLSCLTLAR